MREKLTKAMPLKSEANGEAWGIMNPYGELWTFKTFVSSEAAEEYIHQFWKSVPAVDKSGFRPVRVRVRVTPIDAALSEEREAQG